MNSHLSDEQLIGYGHCTLTDAEREVMDSHFTRCPECRARLADHKALQRRIRHSLLADLKAAQPAAGLGFSAVAPRLRPQNHLVALWRQSSRLVRGATAVIALAGLVVAVISLFGGVGRLAAGVTGVPVTPLPVAACFLFASPVANNCRESRVVPSQLILSYVLAFVLWVGTAILGIYEIYLVREMIFAIYARFVEGASSGTDYWAALTLGNAALLPLSIGWIALVTAGGEYHFKHVGQRCSWKLFGWTIAIQLLILLLPWLL